jgi:hypothetical protein
MFVQKDGTPYFDEMKDLCFGIWSRGGAPEAAKLVRLRVGKTVKR